MGGWRSGSYTLSYRGKLPLLSVLKVTPPSLDIVMIYSVYVSASVGSEERNMASVKNVYALIVLGLIVLSTPFLFAAAGQNAPSFTVKDARTLPPEALGERLIGSRIGRVVAAQRREYDSSGKTPREVDLFLTPKMPWPYIRNICSVDVVTVEYNWFDFDGANESESLKLHHIEAKSRFLPSVIPIGDDVDYSEVEASCSKLTNVERAFRAPDAGDAQWLVAMHREYSSDGGKSAAFPFECSDFEDRSCAKAASAMRTLALENSVETIKIDCEMSKSKDQVNYCYKLTFIYPNSDDPEWYLNLYGGMSDGSAPVRIRRAVLEHVRKPIVMH